jgi:uncharacterized membrane protein YtjA (UPF0391 family)
MLSTNLTPILAASRPEQCALRRSAALRLRNMNAITAFYDVSSYAEDKMGNLLYWAVIFLIVALVAAFLGFGGIAGVAVEGARILFWIALVLLVVSVVLGLLRRA